MRAVATISAAALGAAGLGWASVAANLERACAVDDTPYLGLCAAAAPGSAAQLAALRSRIGANPGDTNAYVQLALADRSAPGAAAAAARLAPNHPDVLTVRTAAALDRREWSQAIPALVQLTEQNDRPQAARMLAALIAAGHGSLLSPYLTPGSRWLPRALAQLRHTRARFSVALPLVVQALQAGVLDPEAVLEHVRQLKAAGAWVDAYSLWVALNGKPLPLLYNGSFDQALVADAFDWEIPPAGPASRAGAFVDRRGAEERGAVLDIRFSGRPMVVPLVHQYVFLDEGMYRLRGEYLARELRIEHGLAWSVGCTGKGAQTGKSGPLHDTAGRWQPFSFEFSVPRECGFMARLQLETHEPVEAVLGARGRVAFDALSLQKIAQ